MLDSARITAWISRLRLSASLLVDTTRTDAMLWYSVVLAFLLPLLCWTAAYAWNASTFWKRHQSSPLRASLNNDKTTYASAQQRRLKKHYSSFWEEVVAPVPKEQVDWNNQDLSADESEDLIASNTTHFCFLVHGHRGFARDLGYLQFKMKHQVSAREGRQPSDSDMSDGGGNVNTWSAIDRDVPSKQIKFDLVVHAPTCNEQKTTDGVAAGGQRLLDEMLRVMRSQMKCRSWTKRITISILGNSLGGLYARYAIAQLVQQCRNVRNLTKALKDNNIDDATDPHIYMLDDRWQLHFNIFCTTATPHLGIAGHTFLPLPRSAEIGMAHAMGNTGRDLFRVNSMLKDMATDRFYLDPLASFAKRVAYANAYATDFPVPTNTAAFLNPQSDYPHHFAEVDGKEVVVDDSGLVIATVLTQPNENCATLSPSASEEQDKAEDDLAVMSASLDGLGWKKVFIDVRKEVPRITLPRISTARRSSGSRPRSNSFITMRGTWFDRTPINQNDDSIALDDNGDRKDESSTESDDAALSSSNNNSQHSSSSSPDCVEKLRSKRVVSSKDLASAISLKPFEDDAFHWPLGHNMIVAFSRSRWSAYMNKGGRPVVDALAKELIDDMLKWRPIQDNHATPLSSGAPTPASSPPREKDAKQ